MTWQPTISRRFALVLFAFLLFCATASSHAETPSLKDAYKNDFLIGTALDFRSPTEFNETELANIKSQFNVITPENSMKPGVIHPAEDRWSWEVPDALVKFCQDNQIKVIGHCLAWHSQTGNWFFQGEGGQPVTKEKALERLENHIKTEVGHFKGKIKGWDVVNEAINDGGNAETAKTENLRQNAPWIRAVGPEFLTYAFKFAHEADPDAELHYNDYNIEKGPKHQSSLVLLKRLIADGAPITAVGIQGHWSLSSLPYDDIDKAIEDYKALGLKVMITELDITMRGGGGGQLGGPGGAQGAAGPSEEQLKAQAEAYAKLFAIFRKHKDAVTRVTFWGLNDARSWRRGQAPLLFDGQNQPKPAIQAIADVAKNASN
jgi:GH35 family endo-1,4-beta-xylanase